MTPEELDRLDRLERLCAAATPGPWKTGAEDGTRLSHVWPANGSGAVADCSVSNWQYDDAQLIANAIFIAAARTALPDLIAEVRRLSDLNGKLTSDFNSLLVHESRTEDQRNAARAEVERLTEQAAHLTADLYARDVEVERLREALKPFAKFANRFGETAREDDWQLTHNPSGKGNLTMGDVRAARAALAPIPPGQELKP